MIIKPVFYARILVNHAMKLYNVYHVRIKIIEKSQTMEIVVARMDSLNLITKLPILFARPAQNIVLFAPQQVAHAKRDIIKTNK